PAGVGVGEATVRGGAGAGVRPQGDASPADGPGEHQRRQTVTAVGGPVRFGTDSGPQTNEDGFADVPLVARRAVRLAWRPADSSGEREGEQGGGVRPIRGTPGNPPSPHDPTVGRSTHV